METNTTAWWTCTGCGVDVELVETQVIGCVHPCPDCDDEMIEWVSWELTVRAA